MTAAPDMTVGYGDLADLLVGIEQYRDDPPIRSALVLTALAQAYACGLPAGVAGDPPLAVIHLPSGPVAWPMPTVELDRVDAEPTHHRCAEFIAAHYREEVQ